MPQRFRAIPAHMDRRANRLGQARRLYRDARIELAAKTAPKISWNDPNRFGIHAQRLGDLPLGPFLSLRRYPHVHLTVLDICQRGRRFQRRLHRKWRLIGGRDGGISFPRMSAALPSRWIVTPPSPSGSISASISSCCHRCPSSHSVSIAFTAAQAALREFCHHPGKALLHIDQELFDPFNPCRLAR